MPYRPILDAEIQPEQPITSSLIQRLRDNPTYASVLPWRELVVTGSTGSFTVPTGITTLFVCIKGGNGEKGGEGLAAGGPGASGARVLKRLAVEPGDVIRFVAGSSGSPGVDNVSGGGGGGGGGKSSLTVGVTTFTAGGGGGGGGGSGALAPETGGAGGVGGVAGSAAPFGGAGGAAGYGGTDRGGAGGAGGVESGDPQPGGAGSAGTTTDSSDAISYLFEASSPGIHIRY